MALVACDAQKQQKNKKYILSFPEIIIQDNPQTLLGAAVEFFWGFSFKVFYGHFEDHKSSAIWFHYVGDKAASISKTEQHTHTKNPDG